MPTIAMMGRRGGCGRTTLAVHVAWSLARSGERVALIDLDPKADAASVLGVPQRLLPEGYADALAAAVTGRFEPSRLACRIDLNLDLFSCSAGPLSELRSFGAPSGDDFDGRLVRLINAIAERYDWVIIDAPASLGPASIAAAKTAAGIVTPFLLDTLSLREVRGVEHWLGVLRKRFGVEAKFASLVNQSDRATPIAEELTGQLRREAPAHLCPFGVRCDRSIAEAAALGVPAPAFAPRNVFAEDVALVTAWIRQWIDPSELPDLSTAPRRHDEQVYEETTLTLFADWDCYSGIGLRQTGDDHRAAEHAAALPGEQPPATPTGGDASLSNRAAELAERARRLTNRADANRRVREADPRVREAMEQLAGGATTPRTTVRPEGAPPRSTPSEVARLYGVRRTARGLLFVQPASAASSIGITGDHDRWALGGTPMRYNAAHGVFELFIPAKPEQVLRYRVVYDGYASPDPFNTQQETGIDGQACSVASAATPAALN